MKREDVFDEERQERARYMEASTTEEILLPITKDGFQALLETCAAVYNLPVDEAMSSVLAGYVHHIGNEKNTTTIEALARVLYKSMSNALTWQIDQDIKAKRRELAEQMRKENDGKLEPGPEIVQDAVQ